MGKIIGIDLGTTNSVVAAMEGGEPQVITNAEGWPDHPVGRRLRQERGAAGRPGRQAPGDHQPGEHDLQHQALHGAPLGRPRGAAQQGPGPVHRSRRTRSPTAIVVTLGQRQDLQPARDQRDDPPEAEGRRRGVPGREGDRGGHHRARPTSTTPSARRPRTPAASPGSTSSASSTSRPHRPWPTGSTSRRKRRSPSTTWAAARSTSRSSSSSEGVFEVRIDERRHPPGRRRLRPARHRLAERGVQEGPGHRPRRRTGSRSSASRRRPRRRRSSSRARPAPRSTCPSSAPMPRARSTWSSPSRGPSSRTSSPT